MPHKNIIITSKSVDSQNCIYIEFHVLAFENVVIVKSCP